MLVTELDGERDPFAHQHTQRTDHPADLLIPVLVVVFYLPFQESPDGGRGVIFAVAAITDWFDGYLARRLGQMTAFGAFLDPVADKLMVAIALVLLVERHDTLLFTLAACVIIGREIVISALREWMAESG